MEKLPAGMGTMVKLMADPGMACWYFTKAVVSVCAIAVVPLANKAIVARFLITIMEVLGG